MKAKNQRLVLLILAVAALLAAVLLGMWGLRDNAAYFYAPEDIARKGRPLDRAVRIGGMVTDGSLERLADGVTISFAVHDQSAAPPIRVLYTGIPPALFQENSGVVAEGRFRPDGTFAADEILAKHDENYMPPQLAGEKHKSESLQ